MSSHVLFQLDLDLRVLSGEAVDVVLHVGVPGGAEEAAGDGRLIHTKDVRVADVVDVRQRHGAQQRLHKLEGVVVELVAGERRHDHRDAAPQARLERVAADERARQGDHLERRRRRRRGVVAQELLLGERLG